VAVGSWVSGADDSLFSLANLPYAVTADAVVVAIGSFALDVTRASRATSSEFAELLATPSLNRLLASGPVAWQAVRAEVVRWLSDPSYSSLLSPLLLPREGLQLMLPFTVGDYVDFYASEQHARNLGRILRPGQEPLLPNWKHLPVGYHGRSGTVVVSGTPVRRPSGQRAGVDGPAFGPTERLDIEAEVGFVVGVGSTLGSSVGVDEFAERVFGVCLVNDWSARDIQAWEYQPLGPMLGKSFATSISAWVTPLAALSAARVPVGSAATALLPYLRESAAAGLDLTLEIAINGDVVSQPPFRAMHWSAAQMLAHLTVNGASVRTGDLFASGTVSGSSASEWGSLIELFDNTRFLEDGDEVVITASAPGAGGMRIGLGEVRGRVVAAGL
jgi:fumarylacetoacetase